MEGLKKTLVFLSFYVLYILAGSFLFNAFECPQEVAVKRAAAKEEEEFMIVMDKILKKAEEMEPSMGVRIPGIEEPVLSVHFS